MPKRAATLNSVEVFAAHTQIRNREDPDYPRILLSRFGSAAPGKLFLRGNAALLDKPLIALFCSARCPGSTVLGTFDQVARWRDEQRCIISGFHSQIEKECLRILLRGNGPVILCLARGLPKRMDAHLQEPLTKGRLLLLTEFNETLKRPTTESALQRNLLAAALAQQCFFAHSATGSKSQQLKQQVTDWGIPVAAPTINSD